MCARTSFAIRARSWSRSVVAMVNQAPNSRSSTTAETDGCSHAACCCALRQRMRPFDIEVTLPQRQRAPESG
ncbi:MAG TPA: hypothetical protein VGT60_07095 [Candidatus Limnocylindria bacterium]|nr:hypothetical protein [Candidatus Limnocylindria bacterium]